MARQRSGGKRLVTVDGTRVIGKAANGTGTVFYDASSGRWRARWTDATGRRRTVTAATRAEVLARRRGAAEVTPTTTTVADVATQWLHTIAPTVRPRWRVGRRVSGAEPLGVDAGQQRPLREYDGPRCAPVAEPVADVLTRVAESVGHVLARQPGVVQRQLESPAEGQLGDRLDLWQVGRECPRSHRLTHAGHGAHNASHEYRTFLKISP